MKTDGSIWSWGCNIYGQIGDGSFANRNLPVRITVDSPACIFLDISTNTYYDAFYKVLHDTITLYGIVEDGFFEMENMQVTKWCDDIREIAFAKLIDFDNDGTPELVIAHVTVRGFNVERDFYEGRWLTYYLYSYTDGNAELLGTFSEGQGNSGGNHVDIVTGKDNIVYLRNRGYLFGGGYGIFDAFYTVKNGELVAVLTTGETGRWENHSDLAAEEWLVNDVSVSEQEYLNALDTVIGEVEVREFQIGATAVNAVLAELSDIRR
jgi:hypothetical protein